ncbi:dihydrofolate reductase [Propylenella binzhouense]|uniref:Dihydrofolate reductase n=1 Tax=Propylenella binzhouense TaxID=2555902 RepID=A0A964T886_9HYPH|nr:dihydrofolate reductase [Propylenella binzhouense]MYZ50274.1 dihydrofolate reductase [Propylenella binzhouense]
MTRIAFVAAVAANGVIGAGGGLPWHIRADLRRFRAITMGKPVIMGRRTFESIGRPLDGRLNIVVSRRRIEAGTDVEVLADWPAALSRAQTEAARTHADEICVIGGGQIYAHALPDADRLYLTRVDAAPPGDTYFPTLEVEDWQETAREALPESPGDTARGELVVLDRVRRA